MADTSVSYKCLNCGGPLSFIPGKETVTCEYCDTEFKVSDLEAMYAKEQELAAKAQDAKEAKWKTDEAGSEWSVEEAQLMKAFTCSSCGAEIVCDENTMATECVYCGNPTMLPNRFEGMLKPDYIIPFKKTKEEAVLETHRKMIDIQIPLSCTEVMGYTPREDLDEQPYNAEKDITFYEGMAQQYVAVKPGMFAIFFPQDGHAPCISEEPVRKAIFKIKA